MRFALALIAGIFLAHPGMAATLGDDGLHKADWMRETFKDLREDLAEANAEGKRLAVIIEQRGCIYCTKMHNEVFPDPDIDALLNDRYFVVQINMFGDVEVTDFDGEVLSEKALIRKWRVMFTPTLLFFPEEVPGDQHGERAAVAAMHGAFSRGMTLDLLTWVLEHGYESDANFQKYHAEQLERRRAN